jgi:hypothetical protein
MAWGLTGQHDHFVRQMRQPTLRQPMVLGDGALVLRMQALATDRVASDKAIPRTQRAHPKPLQDGQAERPERDRPAAVPPRGTF